MTRSFSIAPTPIQREALGTLFACESRGWFPGVASPTGGRSSALQEEQGELLEAIREELRTRRAGRGSTAAEVCHELLAHLAGVGSASGAPVKQ